MEFFKVPLALVVGRVAHDLETLSFLFEVIEDEFFPHVSDVGDSGCEGNWVFQPFAILGEWVVLLNELVDSKFHVELVGVGIGSGALLELVHHLGSVFEVGGRVKNFLLFDFLFLSLSLFGLLCSFFCLFRLNLFQLLQSLLLIFTELLLLFGTLFAFLGLDFLGLFFSLLRNLLRFFSLHR
jgi:hypothetical protein